MQVARTDNLTALIRKVEEAFHQLYPTFIRRVSFPSLTATQDQGPLDWVLKIDEEAKLADLNNIKPQEQKLMKFAHGLNDEVTLQQPHAVRTEEEGTQGPGGKHLDQLSREIPNCIPRSEEEE